MRQLKPIVIKGHVVIYKNIKYILVPLIIMYKFFLTRKVKFITFCIQDYSSFNYKFENIKPIDKKNLVTILNLVKESYSSASYNTNTIQKIEKKITKL